VAYVYRYLHPRSEAIFYIGKTSGDDISSLAARISAHANEEKFKKNMPRGGYAIEYIDGLSAADADILETALINSDMSMPLLNSQKSGWGKSALVRIDGLTWKSWTPELKPRKKSFLEWNVPDSDDAFYTCDCCGKDERIGRSGSPRHILLKIHSARGSCLSTIWLCDECSNESCGALVEFIENLRDFKRKEDGHEKE